MKGYNRTAMWVLISQLTFSLSSSEATVVGLRYCIDPGIHVITCTIVFVFLYVGSPSGLPFFDHLRSVFIFHYNINMTIFVRW